MGAKYSHRCGNHFPTSRHIFEKCVFTEISPANIWRLAWKRFSSKRSYVYMYRQIPTTKMTVWYVRTDYVFRVNSHCVGETLPNTSQRLIFHFSSYLVIELFHRRCFNDYFLLVFHFFVSSYFLIYPLLPPPTQYGRPGRQDDAWTAPVAEEVRKRFVAEEVQRFDYEPVESLVHYALCIIYREMHQL